MRGEKGGRVRRGRESEERDWEGGRGRRGRVMRGRRC